MTRMLLVPGLVAALVIFDFMAAKTLARAKSADAEWHGAFDTVVSEQVAALRQLGAQGAARPAAPRRGDRAPRSSAFG